VPFLTKLDVRFVDGKNWQLLAPLRYRTAAGDVIAVPEGFVTDFASIPRPLRSLVGDAAGPWAPAAVIHDWLYRTGLVSRDEADAVFHEALLDTTFCDQHVPIRRTKAWAFWLAVRAAGWLAYRPPPGASVTGNTSQ
jgi:hypothetical protein